jgi:hypothetical protein
MQVMKIIRIPMIFVSLQACLDPGDPSTSERQQDERMSESRSTVAGRDSCRLARNASIRGTAEDRAVAMEVPLEGKEIRAAAGVVAEVVVVASPIRASTSSTARSVA